MTMDSQIKHREETPLTSAVLSQVIGSNVTLDTLEDYCRDLTQCVADLMDAHHAYLIVRYPRAEIDLTVAADRTGDETGGSSRSEPLVAQAQSSGRPILVQDAMNHPDYPGDPQFQRLSIRTALTVPLLCGTMSPGVLYLDSRNDRRDWSGQLESLQAAATIIGLRIGACLQEEAVRRQERLAVAGEATLKLSHSVKNVLQMIGGAAEVIDLGLRTGKMDRVKCSWAILLPNIQRMKRLVLDMLDFSKDRPLEIREADFNRTISAATETLHTQVHSELRQRGIKVSFQPGRSMPPVRMDPDRVHEMALNLMLNALDALAERARGGRVKVETWLQLSRQSVGLSVQDNGPGIPPELVKGIFVPFKSGKTRFGTGLGMTIAKQIVDQHGGSIEVDTAAGKGTTFTVYLPILGPAHPSS